MGNLVTVYMLKSTFEVPKDLCWLHVVKMGIVGPSSSSHVLAASLPTKAIIAVAVSYRFLIFNLSGKPS